MEHAGAGDAVADFAGGTVGDDFAEALTAEKEEGVADFLLYVVEALAESDFADVGRRDGDFFAAVELEQAFVANLMWSIHNQKSLVGTLWSRTSASHRPFGPSSSCS
jgi:hypothetical protein